MSESTIPDSAASRRRFELSELATQHVFKTADPVPAADVCDRIPRPQQRLFRSNEFEVDFGISAGAYAFGASLFFVGYAIFEVPSNTVLHRIGTRIWLARIMISWGIVAACFVFIQGPKTFHLLRFPARHHRGTADR